MEKEKKRMERKWNREEQFRAIAENGGRIWNVLIKLPHFSIYILAAQAMFRKMQTRNLKGASPGEKNARCNIE